MRLALIVSALGHAAILLVSLMVLARTQPMQGKETEPVTVDIVPEDEIEKPPKKPLNIEFPDQKITEEAKKDPVQKPEPAPEKEKVEKPKGEASNEPMKTAPAQKKTADKSSGGTPRQAAKPPAGEQNPAGPTERTAAAAATQPTTQPDPFAPDAVPKPLYLPAIMPGFDARASDYSFDALADTVASLPRETFATFHDHLQKCWHPPAGLANAQKLSAVIRIALSPAGTIASEPLLVKASASAEGPALVETAKRALRECQPFGFLPAEKYQEWKILDLSFSPHGLTGGG